jgi:putative spermidine/putrescine transport system substrate-binding protein
VRSSYRFALAGVAAATLLAAGCSSSSSSSGSSSSTASNVNWATEASAAGGGGMNTLAAAAKKEGTLNVIALPPTWANYGTIINTFEKKYGITVNSTLPDGTSQQEVDAVKSENGSPKAPDVLDIGMAVALANTSLFAPYEVSTWSSIPTAQKAPNGIWVQDYGGYMAVGYSSKFGTITSLNQLLGPQFKNAVALNGSPTAANAALNGVMMTNLAEGGTPDNIAKGVDFFAKLKAAGNFSPISATGATIKAGTTEVVLNWDYLNLGSYVGVSNWKVFVPPGVALGGYYAQAINKQAPHPAAARLWEEFLYSQAASGGQNLWLQGGARPVEQPTMTTNGTIDKAAAAKLPAVTGTPVFLTPTQATDASNYLAANWAKAVG